MGLRWSPPQRPLQARVLAFSIPPVERQRRLTFSLRDFSSEPALLPTFQGDAVISVTLAHFLRPFSRLSRRRSRVRASSAPLLKIVLEKLVIIRDIFTPYKQNSIDRFPRFFVNKIVKFSHVFEFHMEK